MNTSIVKKSTSLWDWSGIFFSGLCLLHCVATPVLLAGASIWLLSEWVHIVFIISLIPITFMAARRAYRSGVKKWPVLLLAGGLLTLIIAVIAGSIAGETGEVAITIAGSLLLIAGHLGNRHLHVCREGS